MTLSWNRRTGVAGLLVAALIILAFAIGTAPEADRSDATLLDWYTNSGNQARSIVAGMLGGLAVLAFLTFLVGFRAHLMVWGASSVLVELAYAGGLILAALTFVEIGVGSAIAATFTFSDTFELDPDTGRVVLMIGNIWLPAVSGMPGALFLCASSLASRRSGFLPSWLTWTGFVLTPLCVLAIPGFGANGFLFVLWVLLTSIVLLRRKSAACVPVPS